MKEKLLRLLCCPACKSDLRLEAAEIIEGEVKEGELVCGGCGKKHPIRGFVPRFVESDKYVGNFSFEWLLYRKTQLDSHNSSSQSRDELLEKTGFTAAELKGRTILDVGCGTGRYMEVAGAEGAEVVGVDLSFAVETAVENLKGKPNMHVVQADVFSLPFKPGVFDFIYSIGVLHHTTSTREAFFKLPRLLAPGGSVSIWVYSNESRYEKARNFVTDVYRFFTSRMPIRLLWLLCHLAIPMYYLKKLGKPGAILEILLPTSNSRNVEERVLNTFDWYSPKYQHKHTFAEVEAWFIAAGLRPRRLGFSVAVTGVMLSKGGANQDAATSVSSLSKESR